MDPELSDWTSARDPETDRLPSLISAYDRDLRRVAVAMTDDARRADAAVLATWTWAQRRLGALGMRSEARGRLLRRVAREAGHRTRAPWHVRFRDHLPLVPHRAPAPDPGRDPDVASALAPLTVEDRRMLALRHGVGLTTDEIAAQLDLTGPGVRTHLEDLRTRLCGFLAVPRVDTDGTPLGDREVERRITARLIPYLDRRATSADERAEPTPMAAPEATAHYAMHRTVRPHRFRRRPVIVSGIVLLVAAAIALPVSMLPSGGGPAAGGPTPSPGTLLAVAGWSQHAVVRVSGRLEVLGWAPDGQHVAVAEAVSQQIVVYDQRGAPVRTFTGTDAAWIDSERLLVRDDTTGSASLVLRSISNAGDLLVSWPAPGLPTGIVAAGGGIAVSSDSGGIDLLPGSPPTAQVTFSILRAGAFQRPIPGLPLSWTPDGSRLAYLAAPLPVAGGYRGQLHLLDAATMTDHDLGLTLLQSSPVAIDGSGRYLVGCVRSSGTSGGCVLSLVDLQDGSVEASSFSWSSTIVAWAPDGSVIVQQQGTVLRWAPGDAPVALRWQPDRGNQLMAMATAGAWFAVGMYKGPASSRLVAGAEPPMVVVSGQGVSSLAAARDGRHLAYSQLLQGSGTLVIAALPAAAASPPVTAAGSPAASPTSPGTSFEGMPILTLAQTWTADVTFDGTLAAWGSHVYLQTGGYQTGDGSTLTSVPLTLSVFDITTKAETPIELPVRDDELAGMMRMDSQNLVVEVYRRLGPPGEPTIPCPSDLAQPVAWRILAAPLDADGVPTASFTVLDSGTASRVFTPAGVQGIPCAEISPPFLDVADGLLAYAVEAPTSANPWATRVALRRLPDGSVVRLETAAAAVGWLGLAHDLMAWTEEPDASVSSADTFTLRTITSLDSSARTIALPTGAAAPASPWFQIAGRSLLYTVFDDAGDQPPSAWRLDLDTDAATGLSPLSGRFCSPSAGSSEVVFVRCDDWSASTTFVWRSGHGWAVLDGAANDAVLSISGGWVMLLDGSGSGPRLIGFPVSELTP